MEHPDTIEQAGPSVPVRQAFATHTLADLANDFVLFTPALLTTEGRFDRDPVQEFMRVFPSNCSREDPFCLDFQVPLFQQLGLGRLLGRLVDWDARLYGIVRERWEQCRNFINAICVFDRKRYFYARFAWHDILIADPLAMERDRGLLETIPTVQITCFAVSSNRQFVHIEPAADPPRTRAFPVSQPPVAEIVREAVGVLGVSPNLEDSPNANDH